MTAQSDGDRLAIVIPAHNEATRISSCLESLRPFANAGDSIVVVDAASTDDTSSIAADAGATVLRAASRNRAGAVRAGYAQVSGSAAIVVVAHADMQFPPEARLRLLAAMTTHSEAPGAFFGHRIDDPRWRFRLIERGNRHRARRGLPYGDQAMAMRTSAVAATGGFPNGDELEDLELALQLRERGRWLDLNCPVTIDARHWERGVLRTTLRNWRAAWSHCRHRQSLIADSQANKVPTLEPEERSEAR